mmetsp:Transcript_18250/g.45629  ORF Transcript_18250/g.45629 Transcript_18250/m.45629 type:complete len:247 (-) Transcript_18250:978-1718(-)
MIQRIHVRKAIAARSRVRDRARLVGTPQIISFLERYRLLDALRCPEHGAGDPPGTTAYLLFVAGRARGPPQTVGLALAGCRVGSVADRGKPRPAAAVGEIQHAGDIAAGAVCKLLLLVSTIVGRRRRRALATSIVHPAASLRLASGLPGVTGCQGVRSAGGKKLGRARNASAVRWNPYGIVDAEKRHTIGIGRCAWKRRWVCRCRQMRHALPGRRRGSGLLTLALGPLALRRRLDFYNCISFSRRS